MFKDYIEQFDEPTKDRLLALYEIIKKTLGNAEEKISYGIPTFYRVKGYIVYFAGYKDYVSIYPVHQANGLAEEIKPYLSGKSTARFYHDKPLPKELIVKIVKALEAEHSKRSEK